MAGIEFVDLLIDLDVVVVVVVFEMMQLCRCY